jgi:hypothetical protein
MELKRNKRIALLAIGSLAMFSIIGAGAHAEETDSLDITIQVDNTEIPCFDPSPILYSATWYNSASSSDFWSVTVDSLTSANVYTEIYVSFMPGDDGCGNPVVESGTVQTIIGTVSPELENVAIACNDSPCALEDLATGLISFSADIPAGTASGTYGATIDVSWVPAD